MSARLIADSDLARLRTITASTLPDYLRDLAVLVNTDSGTDLKVGVNAVAHWVAEFLRGLGGHVSTVAHETYGDTVVASFAGSNSGRYLLIGHMDTVFEAGASAKNPFRIANGSAYGPGVADMKGGLLVGLYALRALRGLNASTNGSAIWPFEQLTVVATPDEEVGSPSSSTLIRKLALDSDACLVLEAGRENGDLVGSRKGIAAFRLTVHGVAAHAGVEPERGRNAALEAAHKTIALSRLNRKSRHVTVNVGLISGGTRPNVVPAQCVLEVELRGQEQKEIDAVEAELRGIAERSTVPDTWTAVEQLTKIPAMEISDSSRVLADRAAILATRIGFSVGFASTGGASDANTVAAMGIPTLDGLGPVGGDYHSDKEWLDVDSVVPRTLLLAAILMSIEGRTVHPPVVTTTLDA